MWEFSHKEGWMPKNGCFQTVVLEMTLECLLDYKEIKSMNPEGNQPWMLTEKIDAEAVALILWPPVVKSRIIGKDPDAGKDWRQKRREQQRIKSWDSITDWMNCVPSRTCFFLKGNVLILSSSAVLIGSERSVSESDGYFFLNGSFFKLPFYSHVFAWAARSSKDA